MAPPVDPKRSALLVMDFQTAIVSRIPASEGIVSTVSNAIATARSKGMLVAHSWAAFAEGDVEQLSPNNLMFARFKEDPQFLAAFSTTSPVAQIIDQLKPQPEDVIIRRVRPGPFVFGPSIETHKLFKERGIDTLIIAGIATSGCVLSTVRQAADLDYALYVLEDGCADQDEEVQRVLMGKVLIRQAHVIKSAELEFV